MRLVQLTLRAKESALLHCGPPCSTWVWVNRATSKRSAMCPEGDESKPSVSESNQLLGVKAYLCNFVFLMFSFTPQDELISNNISHRSRKHVHPELTEDYHQDDFNSTSGTL